MTVLAGARIFTGEAFLDAHAVVLDHGRIADVVPADPIGPDLHDLRLLHGGLLAPGFIDLQVNGGGDLLFNHDPSVVALARLSAAHRAHGTTAMLPTVISTGPEVMERALVSTRDALAAGHLGVLGLHLEGPYLSPERAGCHDPGQLRFPTDEDALWLEQACDVPLMVTLAPERVPDGFVERLTAMGIIVSIGHSAATHDQAMAAVAEGARAITHLFNAMGSPTAREPGVLGAALASPELSCGIILDGIHVHPSNARLALAAKPAGKVFLVTDAMPPVGGSAREFMLGERRVSLEDGVLRTGEGVLAGSVLDMASAVRNAVELLDVEPAEALRMASLYPARVLGAEGSRGRIETGWRADLVWLDEDLRVLGTWTGGRFELGVAGDDTCAREASGAA